MIKFIETSSRMFKEIFTLSSQWILPTLISLIELPVLQLFSIDVSSIGLVTGLKKLCGKLVRNSLNTLILMKPPLPRALLLKMLKQDKFNLLIQSFISIILSLLLTEILLRVLKNTIILLQEIT